MPLLGVFLVAACSADGPSTAGASAPTVTVTPTVSPSPSLPALDPGRDPFSGRELYVFPESKAAQAAAAEPAGHTQDVLEHLASVPTAIWLTPEKYPPGSVGPFVSGVVADAARTGALPVFVLYGIPDRDCTGAESAGGLTESTYLPWVTEFAAAAGPGSVVILEPDALASATQCGLAGQRISLLSSAIDALGSGPVVYVDAGHSDWIPVAAMAKLLRSVGVDRVRGIAVNVSSDQRTEDEEAYAEKIAKRAGVRGYVIDTGRNGSGPSNGEWCNPPGRTIGTLPGATSGDGRLDAWLWIKPPGESDGTCHGGPAAGTLWTDQVLRLTADAGW